MESGRLESSIKESSIKVTEKEASQVCRDFAAFCGYMTDNKVKLSKSTGNIGKKDCFALNAFFYVREDYAGPTNIQNKYPIINFFYYIAFRYRILEINQPGMTIRLGRNYQQFLQAPVWEQYALFLAVFLFDGGFARGGDYWYGERVAELWAHYIDRFMEWRDVEKPAVGRRYQWTWKQRRRYSECMDYITPYLEELKLIKVWKKPAAEYHEQDYLWEVEVLPLLEMASELYDNETIEPCENDDVTEDFDMEGADKDWMVRHAWETYICQCMEGKKREDFPWLFGNAAAEGQKQFVDLEVSVRGGSCIRVLRMNLEDSLYDLHQAIQQAVSFDDDHLYEFCVGTGMMKRVYLPPDAINSGNELSVDTNLRNLDLYKGQKFTYLFDFGDRWYFDIKVLEIREGAVEEPEIIKAVGDAPEQYPCYEEEEEWEEEEYRVVISEQMPVSSILNSLEDNLIREEHAALMGTKSVDQKEKIDPEMLRREMERILLSNPERMLMFLPAETREMLSALLQEEWIVCNEKCILAQLYAFGFCKLPEKDEYEIIVPTVVKEIYSSKIKKGRKYDKIADTAKLILSRCGVMEMEVLYSAVIDSLGCSVSCEDFEFLVYGRLHYFGRYYNDCLQDTEYMSCYDSGITQKILEERKRPENCTFVYPDFGKMDFRKLQETPKAMQHWEEYIEFHLNIDWRTAEILIEQIPAMAVAGVFKKEEIVAAYKKMLYGTGSRVTKRAEGLIDELLMHMPLATQKGNARGEDCAVKERDSEGKTLEPKADRQVKKLGSRMGREMEEERAKQEKPQIENAEEGYIQISIFDL